MNFLPSVIWFIYSDYMFTKHQISGLESIGSLIPFFIFVSAAIYQTEAQRTKK